MSIHVFASAEIKKRENSLSNRSVFHRRYRSDNRKEFIITIPGFTGELRKYMTEEEASKWVRENNKYAFISAAKASKSGLHGYEEFEATGKPGAGFCGAVGRAVARGFADKKG